MMESIAQLEVVFVQVLFKKSEKLLKLFYENEVHDNLDKHFG